MGKEDVHESDYLENEEIFADLVNGALYHGKQVVKPEELREQDGELRSILGDNMKKIIRDKVKLWKGTAFVIFAVENQTKVDYHMVFRVMLAESMAYDKQRKKRKAELEAEGENLTPDEFLSGMRKQDRFIPVITIVVYYGTEKPWDGAKTLYELLDVGENAEEVLPYVSNFHLNVFDYHDYDNFEQFHSELRSVFEFLRYLREPELLAGKFRKHKEQYGKLSEQAKVLLAKITKTKKINMMDEKEFQKGEFDMGDFFEYVAKQSELKGRAEGIIEMGHEFGISKDIILEKLQSILSISIEEARDFFQTFETQATA